MRKLAVIFSLLFIINTIRSQSNINEDSLWAIWNDTSAVDSLRMKALSDISGQVYMYRNPDSCQKLSEMLLSYAKSKNDGFWISVALNLIGNSYYLKGELNIALSYYEKCVLQLKENNDEKGSAAMLGNIGSIYRKQGNVLKALDAYHNSMLVLEKDSTLLPAIINNLASLYYSQNNYSKALEYYSQSVIINKKLNHPLHIPYGLNNEGSCLLDLGDSKKALLKFEEALSIAKKNNDKKAIGNSYQLIGKVKLDNNELQKAEIFFFKSFEIFKELKLKPDLLECQQYIAQLYFKTQDYNKATYYSTNSFQLANEIGSIYGLKESSRLLYDLNKKNNNSKDALRFFELYSKYKDSILNDKNKKGLISQQYKYEYDKKALADSIRHQDEIVIHQAEVKAEQEQRQKQRIILYGVIILLGLIGGFSVYLYTRLRLIRKQRNLINEQKKTVDKAYDELGQEKKKVERKNKEIITSINYAKKIQKAILPEDNLIQSFFNEFFVLFQPKDIVGGDFYWYRSFGDIAAIACVDCTGHGVPGGFMSMMGSLLLDKIVQNEQLSTDEILNQLNFEIIRVLKQDAGGEIQDGMDLSLCVVNKKKNELLYSGARNGIYIINNNDVKLYKADMLPAGGAFSRKSKIMKRNFTAQKIELHPSSWVLMFSDGYCDQLGGIKMRSMDDIKFEEILKASVLKTDNKEQFLMDEFNNWRGQFPQVDDLLVMGFKL